MSTAPVTVVVAASLGGPRGELSRPANVSLVVRACRECEQQLMENAGLD